MPAHSKIVPLSQAPYLVLGFDRLGLTRTGHGLSSAKVAKRHELGGLGNGVRNYFYFFIGRMYSDVLG